MAVEATVEGEMREAVSSSRKPLLWGAVAAVVVLAVVGAIAWTQAIWPLNQRSEQALARRAQYFWDMKVAGDIQGAYEYMAESYRRRVTPGGFAREGQSLVLHTGAKVLDVEVDEAEPVAEVDLEIKHRFNREAFVNMENKSKITERWIFENGTWYRWPTSFRG